MAEDKYKTPPKMQEIYDKDKVDHETHDTEMKEAAGDPEKIKQAVKKRLHGQEFMDDLISKIEGGFQTVVDTAATDDPDSYWDDAARTGLSTLQFVGNVASTPGISHGLRLLDSPFWAARQAAGGALEHGLGVDPRYGHAAVGVGEFFVGGKALTGVTKQATKGIKKVQAISKAEDILNFRRKQELGLQMIDRIDDNPRGIFRNKAIYESTLEENFQPTLLKSRQSFGGKEGYQTKATTLTSQADTKFRGLSVSGIANEKLAESQFRWASKTAKRELQKQTPFEGTLPPEKSKGVRGQKLTNAYRAHHETPLLASAELKEGLKPQYAKELDLYVLEQGVPQGQLVENITIIPHDFHVPILHNKLMDIQLGGKGDLTAIMKKRYPGKQVWQLELWERKVVADDLIATVNEAREWTYDFYRTVAALKDTTPVLSNLDIDTIINAIEKSDRFKLNDVIETMVGGPNKRTKVAGDYRQFQRDFTDAVIDEVIGDMAGIQRISPLPRLLDKFAIDDSGLKIALDRLGIMFKKDGTVVRKKPVSIRKINSKKYNKDQLELFDDIEVTTELIQNLKLREMLIRRSGGQGTTPRHSSLWDYGRD